VKDLEYKTKNCKVGDNILFKGWRVSCTYRAREKPIGRGKSKTTKIVTRVYLTVYPHLDFLPIGSARENRRNRVRFEIDLDQAIFSGWRTGVARSQQGVVDALSMGEKYATNYLHPCIRKDIKRVYEWVARTVDWKKAKETSKCWRIRWLDKQSWYWTGRRNGKPLGGGQIEAAQTDQPDPDGDAEGETYDVADSEADISFIDAKSEHQNPDPDADGYSVDDNEYWS
jgi:hypothetical protein